MAAGCWPAGPQSLRDRTVAFCDLVEEAEGHVEDLTVWLQDSLLKTGSDGGEGCSMRPLGYSLQPTRSSPACQGPSCGDSRVPGMQLNLSSAFFVIYLFWCGGGRAE